MLPVAIFRFSRTEGPGYFATFLQQHGIPWQLVKLDEGMAVPQNLASYSGFALMGGPMSANDAMPWNVSILELVRQAVESGQPCLGHCLGGQLMSRALGGVITLNPVKEIGWGEVWSENNQAAHAWLGEAARFTAFQWHGETFSIPPGATRILSGQYCRNQAFALGPHLGLQCHVEMTMEMIAQWSADGVNEIEVEVEQHRAMAVQKPEQMLEASRQKLPALNALADALYRKWLEGLVVVSP